MPCLSNMHLAIEDKYIPSLPCQTVCLLRGKHHHPVLGRCILKQYNIMGLDIVASQRPGITCQQLYTYINTDWTRLTTHRVQLPDWDHAAQVMNWDTRTAQFHAWMTTSYRLEARTVQAMH
jgi:hypothetical protein